MIEISKMIIKFNLDDELHLNKPIEIPDDNSC